MSEKRYCPQCGAELAQDVAQGLCPKCLMQAALGPTQMQATVEAPEGSGSTPGGASPLPREGQVFGGYRLMRLLGRGGMGAAYEAEHLESGRRVALKILSQSLDSGDARARFLREGRLAASINHPNSVYIYGTEEIEGTPAIAMELVPGGTLEERVKQHGPMSPAQAVDAILQIIDGLEAAQAVGVLHRDVKPSNCFIEGDGTVKVGDFGLSISTKGRGDTLLTTAGAFLGTPAFSSPEQLRGNELDVRSDIYAVGVTLYYLLTGQTPFKADNLVRFVAMVLERPAPSPATIRPGIPKGLSDVVLTCLEKQPARRYRDYGQLRDALLPYASTAPTAATLGWRTVAYIIDFLVWMTVTSPLGFMLIGDILAATDESSREANRFPLVILATLPLWVLYFAIPEGIWGATLGKAACRLRVVRTDGSAPGIPRALLRAILFIIVPVLPSWLYFGFDLSKAIARSGEPGAMVAGYAQFAVMAAYFLLAARRRNGYAAVHDLASGLRVIRKPARETRPQIEAERPVEPGPQNPTQIGPYHLLGAGGPAAGNELLAGYDPRLLRRVSIRLVPEGTPPVALAIRSLGRATRMRWLGGRRAPGENWDAYEWAAGKPLLALIGTPQPWRFVRYWLMDLAEELAAGLRDATIPAVLGLDRVWITANGRLKLLDFPAPGTEAGAGAAPFTPPSPDAARVFFNQVAIAALEGRVVGDLTAQVDTPSAPLPLHARDLLEKLAAFPSMEHLLGALRPMMHRVSAIGHGRRLALVAACALLPALMVGAMLMGRHFMQQLMERHPDLIPLQTSVAQLVALERQPRSAESDRQAQALEVYIAGRFRQTITNPSTWTNPLAAGIPEEMRARARQAVAAHPSVSPEELAAASTAVDPMPGEVGRFLGGDSFLPTITLQAGVVTLLLAIGSIACAAIFRTGLAMLAMGVVVVRKDGSRAGRAQCFWRALVAWSPCAMGIAAAFLAVGVGGPVPRDRVLGTIGAVIACALGGFACIAVLSALLPERGIPDRLAGTWLVPR